MGLKQLSNDNSWLGMLRNLFLYDEPPTLENYLDRPGSHSLAEGGYRLKGQMPAGHENGNPLVSVITVVRNGEKTLARAVKSVQEQTYQPIEYIVIDGASKDSTVSIIRSNESSIAYWLSEPDNGIYDAFNKGVALCQGRLIGILNADDWLSPEQIEHAVKSLLDCGASFVFGDVWLHGWKGQDFYLRGDPHYGSLIRKTMPPIYHTTMLFHREVFEKVGLFRTVFKIAGDYDWLIRVHLNGFRGVHNPRIVGHMQAGGKSTTQQHLAICEGFVASMKNGYPLFPSLYHWGSRFIFVNGAPRWAARCIGLWKRGLLLPAHVRLFLSVLPKRTWLVVRATLIRITDWTGLSPSLKRCRTLMMSTWGYKAKLLELWGPDRTVPDGGQKRELLQVFLDARGLYGGLSDIGIEWFYKFGTSIRRALCLDCGHLGKQIITVLEGAGVVVEKASGNNGEKITEWMRTQRGLDLTRFDLIIMEDVLPENPFLSILSDQLSPGQTVILTGSRDEQNVLRVKDLISSTEFTNIMVLEGPLLSLLRR